MSKKTQTHVHEVMPLDILEHIGEVPLLQYAGELALGRFRLESCAPLFQCVVDDDLVENPRPVDAMVNDVPYELKFILDKKGEIILRQDYLFNVVVAWLRKHAPARGKYVSVADLVQSRLQTPSLLVGMWREHDDQCMAYDAIAVTDLAIMAIICAGAKEKAEGHRPTEALRKMQTHLDQYNETGKVVYPKQPPHQKVVFFLSQLEATKNHVFAFPYIKNVRDLDVVPPNKNYCTTVYIKQLMAQLQEPKANLPETIAAILKTSL